MTASSSMTAMVRIVFPHLGQPSGSTSYDCRDNGMDPLHLRSGLAMGQNGVSVSHLKEAEWIQNEDYNDWFRYSKISFPSFCG